MALLRYSYLLLQKTPLHHTIINGDPKNSKVFMPFMLQYYRAESHLQAKLRNLGNGLSRIKSLLVRGQLKQTKAKPSQPFGLDGFT